MGNHYQQYRITVNGAQGPIFDSELPDGLWERAAQAAEDRGYPTKLEERFVTDDSFFTMNGGPVAGYYRLPNGTVIGKWEVTASLNCN